MVSYRAAEIIKMIYNSLNRDSSAEVLPSSEYEVQVFLLSALLSQSDFAFYLKPELQMASSNIDRIPECDFVHGYLYNLILRENCLFAMIYSCKYIHGLNCFVYLWIYNEFIYFLLYIFSHICYPNVESICNINLFSIQFFSSYMLDSRTVSFAVFFLPSASW